MKSKEQIKEENIIILMAFLNDEEICRGGCNEDLESYYRNKYSRTTEEITNLVLIAHAIVFNEEISLV